MTRQKLPPEKRRAPVSFKFSPDELAEFRRRAAEQGQTVTALVRSAVLGQAHRPAAVVPVEFAGPDFDAVDAAAEQAGEKLAAFIRGAAIERARRVLAGKGVQ